MQGETHLHHVYSTLSRGYKSLTTCTYLQDLEIEANLFKSHLLGLAASQVLYQWTAKKHYSIQLKGFTYLPNK